MSAYDTLLETAIQSPDASINSLLASITCQEEISQTGEYPTIHEWFEAQVQKTPHAIAVTCGDATITYANLNRRANQLARYLRQKGVGSGQTVGIALNRGREMLVAIFAVMKAGGAYVPLDPSYPGNRLEQMLEEINAPVLITTSKLRDSVPTKGEEVLCIDLDWEQVNREDDSDLHAEVDTEDLAYIIFTSGSTGKPKGVAISHRNLVASTRARFTYYEEPVRAYLMISSFSFDSSVAGIFWTLCSGGNLVLPVDGLHQDPVELIRLVQSHRVTHFLGLPSLYNLMLQEPSAAKMNSLRAVI
ncbi:MAG: AMP-binding protein, partial [Limisphaerales bacterium]